MSRGIGRHVRRASGQMCRGGSGARGRRQHERSHRQRRRSAGLQLRRRDAPGRLQVRVVNSARDFEASGDVSVLSPHLGPRPSRDPPGARIRWAGGGLVPSLALWHLPSCVLRRAGALQLSAASRALRWEAPVGALCAGARARALEVDRRGRLGAAQGPERGSGISMWALTWQQHRPTHGRHSRKLQGATLWSNSGSSLSRPVRRA